MPSFFFFSSQDYFSPLATLSLPASLWAGNTYSLPVINVFSSSYFCACKWVASVAAPPPLTFDWMPCNFPSKLITRLWIRKRCILKILSLIQETDDGAEDLLGYLQQRGAVWAHPQNSKSFGVCVQVHCSVEDIILTVSICCAKVIE